MLRVHLRSILPVGLTVLAGLPIVVLLLGVYAGVIGSAAYAQLTEWASTREGATAVVIGLIVPVVLLFALACLVWAGTAVRVAAARIQKRRVLAASAAASALGQAPQAALAAVLIVLGVVAAVVLAPILTLAGIVGLVIDLVRRPSSARWPRRSTLVTFAVPFGLALRLIARWSLVLPSIWLTREGLRPAFISGAARSRGHELGIGLTLLVTTLITVGVSEGGAALVGLLQLGSVVDAAVRLIAILLVGPLTLVALTLWWFRDEPRGSNVGLEEPARPAKVLKVRTAILLVAALVLPFTIGVVAAPASAAGGSDVSFRIETDPDPVPANTPVTVRFLLSNPSSSVAGQPTGAITISIDGVDQTGPFTLDGLGGAIELPQSFDYGAHTILAQYPGDATFASAPAELDFTVGDPTSLVIGASGTSTIFGDPLTVTATVSPAAATGNVDFTAIQGLVSTPIGTQALSGGTAALDVSGLAPGDYDIRADYNGGGGYLPSGSGGTVPVTITAADTIISSYTLSPASPSAPGGTITASVTVDATNSPATPTGKVQIFPSSFGTALGEETLVAGSADVQFVLPPGVLQQVWAVYVPDTTGFNTSRLDANQSVDPYTSSVTLTQTSSSSALGEAFTLQATVVDGPTAPSGSVTFRTDPTTGSPVVLGTATIGTTTPGVAELTLTNLAPGSYPIVADYYPAASVAGTSSAVTHTVTKGTVTVTVTGPTTPQAPGAVITISATVSGSSGSPASPVSLKRNGSFITTGALIGGATSFTVAVVAGGINTFTVEYPDDGTYLPRSGSTTVTVTATATQTHLGGSTRRTGVYGDTLTFTGSVTASGGTPTGAVELVIGGVKVADGTLVAGAYQFDVADLTVGAPSRAVLVRYLGDGTFAPSDSSADAVVLAFSKATAKPVVTAAPPAINIGDTVTLTATFPTPGDGPTGSAVFKTTDLIPIVLGSGTIQPDGTATATFVIKQASLQVVAAYSGDGNFAATTSDPLTVTADRQAAVVTLDDPGPIPLGTTANLVAHVVVAGGAVTPTGQVEFLTGGTSHFATLAADGTATLLACAGNAGDCGSGTPLGTVDQTVTARYAATVVNLQGDSAPITYTVGKAVTTTSVIADPTTMLQGSLVYLTATVDAPGILTDPAGSVSFYALIPNGFGGHSEAFLGVDTTLVGGVAQITPTVGSGLGKISWPADGIIARYAPASAPFQGSSGTTPITVTRVDLGLDLHVPAIVPGSPVTVTVVFNAGPGVSDDYAERAVVSVDGVLACQAFVPSGHQTTTCQIAASLLDIGTHTITAAYPGDEVYLPADSDSTSVEAGKRTPRLGPTIAIPVIAGTNVTVTWNVFDPTADGTITVTADGTPWCTVPVTTGSCTGQFGAASATGSLVDVYVRYSGGTDWNQVEENVKTRVNICAAIDVHSITTAAGTVHIDTAPNCGGGTGYLAGTTVTVTATPIAPNVFTQWEKLGGAGFVQAATTPTTSFLVTNDSTTWVLRAQFSVPCFPVTADVTGYGGVAIVPASNCTIPGGGAGWLIGTKVDVYPQGAFDPGWGENDAFVEFGQLPAGGVQRQDSLGAWASLTVNSTTVVPVVFGPQCRTVTVLTAPANAADQTSVVTAQNCVTQAASGFVQFSRVTVTATSTDSTRVLAGWSVDGVPRPDLGRQASPTIRMGSTAPTITANFVNCYPLNLRVDSATDARGRDLGQVNVKEPANCPDGSKRYVAGSVVTLTPEVLVDGASFRGWDPTSVLNYPAPGGKGIITSVAKTFTIQADTVIYAGFYSADSCSRIDFFGDPTLLDFPNDGCGPGYYFDLQKQEALRAGIKPGELHDFKYRSTLRSVVPDSVPTNVYVSIRGGDARNCFGKTNVAAPDGDWQTYGPITRPSDTCDVGGNLAVWAEACQTIRGLASFVVVAGPGANDGQRKAGTAAPSKDISPGGYGPNDIPKIMYLKNDDGSIGRFDLNGYNWVTSEAIHYDGTTLEYEDLDPGPCKMAGNAFPAGRDIGMWAVTPTAGFSFDGWQVDGGVIPAGALLRTTTEEPVLVATALFTITCFHLNLGEGISVEADAPVCPGTDPSQNLYIAGTAVPVKADFQVGERQLYGFLQDIVQGQTTQDADTMDQHGFVFMDGDKSVKGDYLTKTQSFGRGFVQGLKFVSGIAAVAAPILLAMAFPPAGLFLAAAAAGAGISHLIPGGGKAAAFFDLINPSNITECAARWAFNNPTNPKPGANAGAIVATINNVQKIVRGKDVLTAPIADLRSLPLIGDKLPKSIGNLPGALSLSLGAASFGYGLYSAGIANTDLGPATIDQVNNTAAMTSCLDEQWRFAGSNATGG